MRASDLAPSTADTAVVICTRNRPGMLRAALALVAAHTPRDVEVVVVDSASGSAETRDIVLAHGYRYVRSDIRGLSIARNLGYAATSRDIVVYTDDDCAAVEGWVEDLLAGFADAEVGSVTGRMLAEDEAAGDPGPSIRHTSTLAGLDAGHGALMAFRRRLLERLGGFDELLGAGRHWGGAEDLDMLCRVLDAGSAVREEPGAIVRHVHTREDDDLVALYAAYGRGLGAMVNKWQRFRPRAGLALGYRVVGRSLLRCWRSRANRRLAPAERAFLRGVVGAWFAAVRHPVRAGRFVDRTPPEPEPLRIAPTSGAVG